MIAARFCVVFGARLNGGAVAGKRDLCVLLRNRPAESSSAPGLAPVSRAIPDRNPAIDACRPCSGVARGGRAGRQGRVRLRLVARWEPYRSLPPPSGPLSPRCLGARDGKQRRQRERARLRPVPAAVTGRLWQCPTCSLSSLGGIAARFVWHSAGRLGRTTPNADHEIGHACSAAVARRGRFSQLRPHLLLRRAHNSSSLFDQASSLDSNRLPPSFTPDDARERASSLKHHPSPTKNRCSRDARRGPAVRPVRAAWMASGCAYRPRSRGGGHSTDCAL